MYIIRETLLMHMRAHFQHEALFVNEEYFRVPLETMEQLRNISDLYYFPNPLSDKLTSLDLPAE